MPVDPEYPELADVLLMGVDTVPSVFPMDALQPLTGTFEFDEEEAVAVPAVKFHITEPPGKSTVAVDVPIQPEPSVPDTVYTVVTVGVAVTVAPVVALSPAEGNQV